MADIRKLNMDAFRPDGVSVEKQADSSLLVSIPAEGGKMITSGAPFTLGGADWHGMTHLIIEVTALTPLDQCFALVFTDRNAPSGDMCIINTGLLPQVKVTWPVDLSLLDSHRMFPARTPGRLKQMILGRGIALDDAVAMVLSFKKSAVDQQIVIHNIYLTDEMPDCTLHGTPIVDEIGQCSTKEWPGKTKNMAEMVAFLRAERAKADPDRSIDGRSAYGGDLAVNYGATGYFRTHHNGKRWYLVDPDGYRFISTGLDCVIPGDGGYISDIECLLGELPQGKLFAPAHEGPVAEDSAFNGKFFNYSIANLIHAFGDQWWEDWAAISKSRLLDWQFTTVGNWSNPAFCKTAHLPYVWPMKDFPATEVCIFRDFPDVFSEEYRANCEAFAQQLREFGDDPYMVGYFMTNEPQWAFVQGLLIADKVLSNPVRTVSKERLVAWLKERYQTIEALNAAWKSSYASFDDLYEVQPPISEMSEQAKEDSRAFSVIMITEFVSIPAQACKAVDPHHLNLGMRYAQLTDPILLSGYENFDVFSINGYDMDIYPLVQLGGELTGKPVMVGEFQFGAPDVGMLCAGICSVANQHERGIAYRAYYEKAMNSPYFVGAHYFSMNDQPVLGRFDGENMNIGLVDVCHKAYPEMTAEITAVNRDIYKMADGWRSEPEPVAKKIPRMMGF